MAVYDPAQARFSDAAHRAAESQLYPTLFPGRSLTFWSGVGTDWDFNCGIDYKVRVPTEGFRLPLTFTVQERWRKPAHLGYRDVTITEWSLDTGQPSEVYKTMADYMVYGFYDEGRGEILRAGVYGMERIRRGLVTGRLSFTTRSRGDQTFLCVPEADLDRIGATVMTLGYAAGMP